jgi:single-stranded-DNA-specific exonuclease
MKENKENVNLPEYPELIGKLLGLRGITTAQDAEEFLNPDYNKLHDPFLFGDMQKAKERIERAIEAKEKIHVYADYDADAITALSVMYLALKKLGADLDYYIPDRFTEGYGMNTDAIKKIADSGAKLIITVDCGTNSKEEVKLAMELGMDVIITDHHEITNGLPEAYAVINPKNEKDNYPEKILTGVGVAYKLVQVLVTDGYEKWLLDLVAIGTVADLQSLTGENRVLVHFGLKVLSKTRWAGLRALMDVSGIDQNQRALDTYTLGFLIAPRINAAGRIKHGDIAFNLLTTQDQVLAQKLARELNDLNIHRQKLTEQVLSEAKAQVELNPGRKILLVAGDNWPKGVVGLVAGKLTEEYHRPALVMEKDSDTATGSARSVAGFDIVEALKFAKDDLLKFGGHEQAAGFTLENSKIESLHKKLLEFAEKKNYEPTPPEVVIDSEVGAKDLTWQVSDYLTKFGPFGMGNPKPRFIAKGFGLVDSRLVGADGKHLKFTCELDGQKYGAIAFNKGYLADILSREKKFDCVFELEANEWNGKRELQLKIVDLHVQD